MADEQLKKTPQNETSARQEIIAVTRKLIAKYGYSKLSLNDIAKELGKTKGFLYYHFPDKESIFLAAIESEANEVTEQLRLILLQETTGIDKVRAYFLFCVQAMKNALPIILKLREDVQMRNSGILNLMMKKNSEITRMNIPLMENLLREGVRDGSLRFRDEDGDINAMARFVALALQGSAYDYILGDPKADFEESLLAILKVLERGAA